MTGFLNYAVVPFVTEEPLTDYQKRALPKEMFNNLTSVVLEDEIVVVYDDMEDIEMPEVHVHKSTSRQYCQQCVVIAQDEQNVPQPDEE